MQTIYLDISSKGVIPCIQAKQNEVGRKFLAVITDNGVPYDIPDNSLFSVWYEGDTDAGNYSSIDDVSAFNIDGNKITVELVAQMLLKPGKGELCLSVTHADGGETNTWNIPYEVEYKPGAGSSVPTEYYTALTEVASETAKQAGIATQKAEELSYMANDYIVESGNDEVWLWRKWKSGLFECWGRAEIVVPENITESGSMFWTSYISVPYPEGVDIPNNLYRFTTVASGYIAEASIYGNSNESFQFRLVLSTNSVVGTTTSVFLQAIGRFEEGDLNE